MRFNSLKLTAGLAALILSATSSVSAQTWVAVPGPGGVLSDASVYAPGRASWNNGSDDGVGCNIGFILTGAPTANCGFGTANQRPAGWLPYTGAPATQYLATNAGGFAAPTLSFASGFYNVSQLGAGLGGDVAGNNSSWGVFAITGSVFENGANLGSMVNLNTGTPFTFNRNFTFTGTWGLWINTTTDLSAQVFSNDVTNARQFSLFATNNPGTISGGVINAAVGSNFLFGLEDKRCLANCTNSNPSDYDNNDVIGRIVLLPEPSTYAMMGAGLLALVAVSRRRRSV